MELTDEAFDKASIEMATLREQGHATEARYDRKANRLIVSLHNGIELAVPVHLIQGLAHAGHVAAVVGRLVDACAFGIDEVVGVDDAIFVPV